MNTNWNDPNFQGFGRQPRRKKERKAVGTPLGRTLLNIAVTLVFAAVYFYIVLPPISLKSEDFYVFVLLVCAVYGGCAILTSGFQGTGAKGYFTFLKKQCTVPLIAAAALIATALVGAVIGWQLFRAGDYRDLLTRWQTEFAPLSPEEPLDEHFVEALHMMAVVDDLIDCLAFGPTSKKAAAAKRLLDGQLLPMGESRLNTLDREEAA